MSSPQLKYRLDGGGVHGFSHGSACGAKRWFLLDAHLHVVDPRTAGRDRTGNPNAGWWEAIDAGPRAVAARLNAAGVDGGVLVQAVGPHGFDNSVVIAAAVSLGEGWRAMVAVDPQGPDPLVTLAQEASRGATGLRLFSVPTPAVSWLDSEVGVALVEQCGRLGLGPTVCCLPEELDAVERLVAAVPGVEVAIDHVGFVPVGGDDEKLVSLAAHDNVIAKLSTGVFDRGAVGPRELLARLLDLFGPDRIAWGSDHPQIHDRDYTELVALVDEALIGLPAATQAAILEETTARLWF